MGRTSSYCKQVINYFLALALIFAPTFSYAGAAEKWELVSKSYDVAKSVAHVEARQISQVAANSSRYVVDVPVDAATLGSSVKTMLWAGLAVAAVSSLIEGVGWIIDVGSKVIKKRVPTDPSTLPDQPYIWQYDGGTTFGKVILPADSVSTSICNAMLSAMSNKTPWFYDTVVVSQKSPQVISCYVSSTKTSFAGSVSAQKITNPNYNPNLTPQFTPVSDSQLGDEILGHGTEPNSSTSPNPEIITSVYDPNTNTDAGHKTSDALDNALPQPDTPPTGQTTPKPNVDTDGDGKADTYDPTKPTQGEDFTLPAFCSWAVSMCEWYTKYKTDVNKTEIHRESEKSFWQKVQDWFLKWDEEPPKNDDTVLDIPEPPLPDINTDINFGGACPVPRTVPVSFAGISTQIEFSFQPLCDIASFIKPVVITISAFSSALIIAGIREND